MRSFLAMLLAAFTAPACALACHPARLNVTLDPNSAAVAGVPMRLEIAILDESGRACPAERDYPIHLAAADSRGQSVALSNSEVTVARTHSSPAGNGTYVAVRSAGLIRILAQSPGLRAGIATVFVRGLRSAMPAAASADSTLIMPAAYTRVANQVPVIAHCASGGQVSANGVDSIVVRADLEDGPLSYSLKLQFAAGSIEWDGVIVIPAGALGRGVEIHSRRTGPVNLNALLSSDPSAVRLDAEGQQSCAGFGFISPAQYADLEFQSNQISYGEPVQLSVVFRDREYNAIPIDDGELASVRVMQGRQPSFTEPKLGKSGSAVLICKPNWWGRYQFETLDGSLKTISRAPGNRWVEGPVELSVTFPWIPLWFCVLFGSAGAALMALYQRQYALRHLAARVALGVGAAVLIVSLTLQASLLKTAFQPYTLLILTLSLIGGWSGPAAFNWYARQVLK